MEANRHHSSGIQKKFMWTFLLANRKQEQLFGCELELKLLIGTSRLSSVAHGGHPIQRAWQTLN